MYVIVGQIKSGYDEMWIHTNTNQKCNRPDVYNDNMTNITTADQFGSTQGWLQGKKSVHSIDYGDKHAVNVADVRHLYYAPTCIMNM